MLGVCLEMDRLGRLQSLATSGYGMGMHGVGYGLSPPLKTRHFPRLFQSHPERSLIASLRTFARLDHPFSHYSESLFWPQFKSMSLGRTPIVLSSEIRGL